MSANGGFQFGEDRLRDIDGSGRAMGYDSVDVKDWPETDLHHAKDNRMRPREVTLMSEAARLGKSNTEWITASIDDAMPIEEVR